MSETKTILVVDDEPSIAKVIDHRLSTEGYRVITAGDGEQALKLIREDPPDLIVLDLMLPRLDGFEVCRRVREESAVPIIILSAKGDELDKLMGFRMGSDDYVTKPFSPSELLLRIQAILRRSEGKNAHTAAQNNPNVKAIGRLKVDRISREVEIDGVPVQLTPKEFDLLWLLVSHPNKVFTREELLEQVWGSEYLGDAENVTVVVSRLRDKLQVSEQTPSVILTVWGVGYKLGIS